MSKFVTRPPFRRGEVATKPEVQERLRRFVGSKGLPDLSLDERVKAVIDVARLEDPLYARSPMFWACSAAVTAVAGNNSKLGVQTLPDPNLVCVVDDALIAADANLSWSIIVVQGGQVLAAVTTDTNVFMRNRSVQDQGGQTGGVPLLRIADNGVFAGGGAGPWAGSMGQSSIAVQLGYVLYSSEQLMIVNNAVNAVLRASLRGRVLLRN